MDFHMSKSEVCEREKAGVIRSERKDYFGFKRIYILFLRSEASQSFF